MKLEAHHLDFGYRGRTVGSDACFTLAAGEVVCLLGPNGGGKTTLFKTLLGLLPPRGGRVLLDGVDLATLGPSQIARAVAYVPQAQVGYFPYTVAQMVLMGRTAHLSPLAVPGPHDRAIAAEALERMGLAPLAEAAYTRISGGERQLALIARALAQQAPLVVMDEPTASLDLGNQMRVLRQIENLAARGIGVLISTHDPDQAFLCARRVMLMHEGRIAAIGSPDEVITPAQLKQVYGADVHLAHVTVAGHSRTVCVPLLHEGSGAAAVPS